VTVVDALISNVKVVSHAVVAEAERPGWPRAGVHCPFIALVRAGQTVCHV